MCHCSERAVGRGDRGARVTNFSHKAPLIDHMSVVESPRAHVRIHGPPGRAARRRSARRRMRQQRHDHPDDAHCADVAGDGNPQRFDGAERNGGSSVHGDTASGTVSVTLTSVVLLPSIVLGLGIGIPGSSGADCKFSKTVNTPPGRHSAAHRRCRCRHLLRRRLRHRQCRAQRHHRDRHRHASLESR